jgi:hypothetical protein
MKPPRGHLILKNNPTLNEILNAGICVFEPLARGMVFWADNRVVMEIKPDGELIVTDATEAAKLLIAEWRRQTGRAVPCETESKP